MATVYEGHDLRLVRKVACKILHPHLATSDESRERLAREARAIAQVRHDNIIEVYDYSADVPDCTYLITELVEGCSLRQFVDYNGKPLPEIATMITAEILRALRAAHAGGVVHRDVKPDNVLIGQEGRPKLSDFGIAKLMTETRMTLTGHLVGSPSYMSPEQADGIPVDRRSDLFSLGSMMYRLIAAALPFRGRTAIETMRMVARGDYRDIQRVEPDCPDDIAHIIRRALTVDRNRRYVSADDMLDDVRRVLDDRGLSDTWRQLPRYFDRPQVYTNALRQRLPRLQNSAAPSWVPPPPPVRSNEAVAMRSLTMHGTDPSNARSESLPPPPDPWRPWLSGITLATITAAAITTAYAVLEVISDPPTQIHTANSDQATSSTIPHAPVAAPHPPIGAAVGERPPAADRDRRERRVAADRDHRERTPAADRDRRERTPAADRDHRERTPAADRDRRERTPAADRDRRERTPAADRDRRERRVAARPLGTKRTANHASPNKGQRSRTSGRASGADNRSPGPTDNHRENGDAHAPRALGARASVNGVRPGVPPAQDVRPGVPPAQDVRPGVPPAQDVRPAQGVLHVGASVWVDVYVDGRRVGRAPDTTRYTLAAGTHTIRAEQPGSDCVAFERRVTIQPGETTRLRLLVQCP